MSNAIETSSEPFDLIEDDQHKLILRRPGRDDLADVRIRRAFPWSKPGEFVSIRNAEGKEVMLIDQIGALRPNVRDVIQRWLTTHSFIPKIQRIDSIDVRFGYQQWQVHTDRGPAEFRVQEREDIRFLPDGRFSVKDADGNIFELPRLDQLDSPSRSALEPLL